MTSPLRLGNEAFWLSDADAAEVQRLCAFDRQAGLAELWLKLGDGELREAAYRGG
jgi:hypothetical protein